MYIPTPYHWTDDDGVTHVFYNDHMPPSEGFGWLSLCEELHLPTEGNHFEITPITSPDDIACNRCRSEVSDSIIELDDAGDASYGTADDCLIHYERNEAGEIVRAKRVFHSPQMLHHALDFELQSLSGDLTEGEADVCSSCWETYVDHQWSSRDQGGELCIETIPVDGRSAYFTTDVETIQRGNQAALELTSKHGLIKRIRREDIEKITLTPGDNIVY
jgi:hypothetical protein